MDLSLSIEKKSSNDPPLVESLSQSQIDKESIDQTINILQDSTTINSNTQQSRARRKNKSAKKNHTKEKISLIDCLTAYTSLENLQYSVVSCCEYFFLLYFSLKTIIIIILLIIIIIIRNVRNVVHQKILQKN